ncbi:ribosomal RNA small subunit methyltransferase E [Andreesenia angusta]|uniref:Ribosomal RNA small subunit methyltransferase E n=1 Tax=Andreesenia angusta TaxID=39480 RepID=A0A1S1V807_9FIRM|nr:16S rRNA (uracil(1498)-N(3))-methyltransferase [Andreesenia angusta]OHW62555.1 ribosomal RNA small subunit methyltransferase E [Andreesenia angusta]
MHRFFVDRSQISGEVVTISGEDLKHIKNVLRLKEGEEVSICDGEENDYVAVIESIDSQEVLLSIVESFKSKGEAPIKLKLYQGLPKGDKMELIVQKCTELGVSEIVPMATKRAVVKLSDEKKIAKKLERWQKIAEEAAKQSKRGRIPLVDRLVTLKEAVSELGEDELALMLYESERENSLKKALRGYDGKNVSVFVGPEGGFEESEAEMLKAAGAKVVSLGNRILRTETAGLAASAVIMYELGDLGDI